MNDFIIYILIFYVRYFAYFNHKNHFSHNKQAHYFAVGVNLLLIQITHLAVLDSDKAVVDKVVVGMADHKIVVDKTVHSFVEGIDFPGFHSMEEVAVR